MATIPLTEWTEAVPALIPVEEYLHTTYRPDCDYVDGIIEERNLGEFEHGRLQLHLGAIFLIHEQEWNSVAVPECRLQLSKTRYRIPDLLVLRDTQKVSRIVCEAPLLCIEVLSPADTWMKMRERLSDYVALGVEHIWCFDPDTREARIYTATGFTVVTTPDLSIPGTPIRLNLVELFSILD